MRLAISSEVGSRPSSCTSWRLRANQLVDRLDHVHRDADGAGLVGDGAGDGLANPPGGVGRKLVAAAPLELVHGLHQADVAFLNQIEELQAAVGVFLGDGNHQAEVGLDQFFLGLLGFRFAAQDDLQRALQFGEPDFAGVRDFAQFGAARAQFAARFGGVIALGGVGAALQLAGFALERLQPLDGVPHLVDQALALERIELERARQLRHLDARARHAHSARAGTERFLDFGVRSSLRACLSATP